MPEPDALHDLGVTLGSDGGRLRVWSGSATAMEACLFDDHDLDWVVETLPMSRDDDGVWSVESPALRPGARYSIRADGPGPAFDVERHLIDPYARGLQRTDDGRWRAAVLSADDFDWGDSRAPGIPLDRTVVYEAHVKGISKLNPGVPEHLRGTYAGLAHPATVEHLLGLGVTTVQLLPVHQSVSERRLARQGLVNYWGYNTLNFFTPHAAYASAEAQAAGPDAVLREIKGMVRLLHEAGLEVVLDVVYNHTAEEGRDGPTTSLRGLDDRAYYRQSPDGEYIDVTGCGNSLNTATPAAARLVLDSLRYWAQEVRVDGFRFDLAVTLGRDADHVFTQQHPLLTAIRQQLPDVKLIAEPWDVGMGGWQVGGFAEGWLEWNDGYRDDARRFWLTDVASAREHGVAPSGIGALARRLTGSEGVFPGPRGPLASVNFVTAHDGFTAADLTAYDVKRNLGNGEENRDGTNDNHSFDHGAEGDTDDRDILDARRKAIRNLLGTLLLSAGTPMLTAGDESGRSQRGNNNAYCHDSELTWLSWDLQPWQRDLLDVTRRLVELRRTNPALRPGSFGRWGETVPDATQMDWYNKQGLAMSVDDWDSPDERTLQYLAATTPDDEQPNRILLVVHGLEQPVEVTLPPHEGVSGYTLLWDSDDADGRPSADFEPGQRLRMAGTTMVLLQAHG